MKLRFVIRDAKETAAGTGCPLRDLYLATDENDRGKSEPGWYCLMSRVRIPHTYAERLAEFFRQVGVEVVEEVGAYDPREVEVE